ncbi:MAG: thiamine-phosphate kinase [Candidatus Bathyarchaeia archaeon]
MRVSEVGEIGTHERIQRALRRDPRELLGYGDDAISMPLEGGGILIAHTDVLIGSRDVLEDMGPFDVGWKAAVMNLSDVISKGAAPMALLFSWGIPGDYELEVVAGIASGMDAAAKECGAFIGGGDTSEADDLILAGFCFGMAKRGRIIGRRGARPGDILASTGPFGLTAVAFKVALEGLGAPGRIRERAMRAVCRPALRFKEGMAIAELGSASAGMDCSDGLAKSIHWLSRMSGVGFELSRIPIPEEVMEFAGIHGLDPYELALYAGGEEYELLYCIKPELWGDTVSAVEGVGGRLEMLGRATEGGVILNLDGAIRPVEDRGWEHFKGWSQGIGKRNNHLAHSKEGR